MGGRPEYCGGAEVAAPNRDEIGVDPIDQATVGGQVYFASEPWFTGKCNQIFAGYIHIQKSHCSATYSYDSCNFIFLMSLYIISR